MSIKQVKEIRKIDIQEMVREALKEDHLINGFHICKICDFPKVNIAPYRGSFYGVGLITNGGIEYLANLDLYTLLPNTITFSHPFMIRAWNGVTAFEKGYILSFTPEFFISNELYMKRFQELSCFDFGAAPVKTISEAEKDVVLSLYIIIYDIFHSDKSNKEELIRNYLNILLLEIEEILSRYQRESPVISKVVKVVQKFKNLVTEHYMKKRSVKEYAELLTVNATYLAETVKQVTGKTPNHFIGEMVVLEAKVLLKYTELTVSEIAYRLNFEDPSYFGRFFKKYTGSTPLEYRGIT